MHLRVAIHDTLQVVRGDVIPRKVGVRQGNNKPVVYATLSIQ